MEGCLTWCWLMFLMLYGPVVTSDHSAVFIEVVLEPPIPHLVCMPEVYLQNSVDWELVREDVEDINWNRIFRYPCPVSSLNEALLRGIREFSSGQLWLSGRLYSSLGLMTGAPWLIMQSREHIECGVIAGRRLIGSSIKWHVVVLSWSMEMLNEHSRSGANHSWHMLLIHRSGATLKTAVFCSSSSFPTLIDRESKLVWSPEEKVSLFSAYFDA